MADVMPIFDLLDHFDTTIAIGEQQLPIRVKRFTRGEMDTFEKTWDALIETPRGTAELTAEAAVERTAQQVAFFEQAITEAITLDEGLVRDRGAWVTTGAGLIEIFHSRKDVLSDLLVAIYIQNRLGGVIRKNWNSPRASESGSAASTPARGGDAQGSTADRVERSTTAGSDAATAPSSADPAVPPASSGGVAGPTKVH